MVEGQLLSMGMLALLATVLRFNILFHLGLLSSKFTLTRVKLAKTACSFVVHSLTVSLQVDLLEQVELV